MSKDRDFEQVIKQAKDDYGETGVYVVGFIAAVITVGLAVVVGILSYYAYMLVGWLGSVLIISIGLHTASPTDHKWIWVILSFVSAMAVMMM